VEFNKKLLKEESIKIFFMRKIVTFIAFTFSINGCFHAENFDSKKIKSITVLFKDSSSSESYSNASSITEEDSVHRIIEYLNKAEKEPIKFYPTHELRIIYVNGQSDPIFCSGSSIKYKGITYRLSKNIRSILGR